MPDVPPKTPKLGQASISSTEIDRQRDDWRRRQAEARARRDRGDTPLNGFCLEEEFADALGEHGFAKWLAFDSSAECLQHAIKAALAEYLGVNVTRDIWGRVTLVKSSTE